jgi:hypothetical protein
MHSVFVSLNCLLSDGYDAAYYVQCVLSLNYVLSDGIDGAYYVDMVCEFELSVIRWL